MLEFLSGTLAGAANLLSASDSYLLAIAPHTAALATEHLARLGVQRTVDVFVPVFPIDLGCTPEEKQVGAWLQSGTPVSRGKHLLLMPAPLCRLAQQTVADTSSKSAQVLWCRACCMHRGECVCHTCAAVHATMHVSACSAGVATANYLRISKLPQSCWLPIAASISRWWAKVS